MAILEEKTKILEFAINKFISGGFYKTSMDEIASQMHISKKTIYKYYSSKEELVQEVAHEFLRKNHLAIREKIAEGNNAVEKLFGLMKYLGGVLMKISQRMLSDFQTHMPAMWKEIDEFRTKKMTSFLGEIIEQGKKEGYFINENTDLLLTVFISSIRGVVNPSFSVSNKVSMSNALETTITILLNGILTDKGEKIFNKLKDGAGK